MQILVLTAVCKDCTIIKIVQEVFYVLWHVVKISVFKVLGN
jgi:hypothetical protein